MLWEEMEKYTKLTGEDATHVPIMKIGAYLDGYEKGTEVLDKIRAEIMDSLKALDDIEKFNIYLPNEMSGRRVTFLQCLKVIDKYKAESEG